MRILHTADLHLGSPLRAASARLRGAADGVLARIVDLALAEQVDALVIAGDMLDRDEADLTLRGRLAVQLTRAVRGGVPVVMIRGNHDALMDYDRFGPLGDGIHLLTRDTPSVTLGGATFHGLGFDGRHQPKSLLPHYPPAVAGQINIGLMHTSLGGSPGHDPYAPVAPGDLLAHGYDYWALGHIHQRSEVIEGGTALVMPGIPQGRHAGEAGHGSVTLATLGGTPSLETRPTAQVVFETHTLDLTDRDQGQIIDAIRGCAPSDGPHRMLRLRVRGSDQPAAMLVDLATAALEDVDTADLEALRIDARPALQDGDALMGLARAEVAKDSFQDEAARLLADLHDALPADIRDTLGPDQLDALVDEGLAELAAALRGTDGSQA